MKASNRESGQRPLHLYCWVVLTYEAGPSTRQAPRSVGAMPQHGTAPVAKAGSATPQRQRRFQQKVGTRDWRNRADAACYKVGVTDLRLAASPTAKSDSQASRIGPSDDEPSHLCTLNRRPPNVSEISGAEGRYAREWM